MDSRTKTYSKPFCPKALVPNALPVVFGHNFLMEATILDFGCGKDAYWVNHYRKLGYKIHGKDLSRPDLVTSDSYDIIMLSNVINVQETEEQLNELLACVLGFKPKYLLFNYPSKPRKLEWSMKTMEGFLKEKLDGFLVMRLTNPKLNQIFLAS